MAWLSFIPAALSVPRNDLHYHATCNLRSGNTHIFLDQTSSLDLGFIYPTAYLLSPFGCLKTSQIEYLQNRASDVLHPTPNMPNHSHLISVKGNWCLSRHSGQIPLSHPCFSLSSCLHPTFKINPESHPFSPPPLLSVRFSLAIPYFKLIS